MSDSVIFITLSVEELNSREQLPGDVRALQQLLGNDERLVHLEALSDAPLPEKTAQDLLDAGAQLTVVPGGEDTSATLTGGLMSRVHEFSCAFAQVSQYILAGTDAERLVPVAAFLRRAGYNVILVSPDRAGASDLRGQADRVRVWSGRASGGRQSQKDDSSNSAPKLDPYEVLVDEVTRGREKGQRVLLTSLKQRMRRRMRRFDETRMKDLDGRPMRKFKDFIEDAAGRNLIQLIDRGNRSHVLLPGEEIPEDDDSDQEKDTRDNSGSERPSRRAKKETGDPLLDTVEVEDAEKSSASEEEAEDIPFPSEDSFDVKSINEDALPPSGAFMESLEGIIPEKGITLGELLHMIHEKSEKGEWKSTNREFKRDLQSAFYNELLEPASDESPTRYVVVDDWKRIIDFL